MPTKLKRFNYIKNLGLFHDYSWEKGLKDFSQYNVIYGWNGVGKTTLSKLFSALGGKDLTEEHPDLTYKITIDDNSTITNRQQHDLPIKVFNTDYITENINFSLSSSKSISLILGKENNSILEKITADEKLLEDKLAEINENAKLIQETERERGAIFTSVAKVISQSTNGAVVRNYTKASAEKTFRNIKIPKSLSKDRLQGLEASALQEKLPEIPLAPVIDVGEVKEINATAKKLMATTVTADTIKRLEQHRDISDWVEVGLKLHSKHKNNYCEFCHAELKQRRIEELNRHFNEADANLKDSIDTLLSSLKALSAKVEGLNVKDEANVYKEYRQEYIEAKDRFNAVKQKTTKNIEAFSAKIADKKAHTTRKITIDKLLNFNDLSSATNEINSWLAKHNEKTRNFATTQEQNAKLLEEHYLSTVYDNISSCNNKISSLEAKNESLTNGDKNFIGINRLDKLIKKEKAMVSSTEKAREILNDSLCAFLGYDEITFQMGPDNIGYSIYRKNMPAKQLSEGEKTAIAFVFFLTQLDEEGFNKRNGIVVIDDPIFSLDANSRFQAFSFMKNATKEVGQLFIFTHNFDFMKLTLNWLKYSNGGRYSSYMIKNSYSSNQNDGRTAYIDVLDQSLEKFESEYKYLFHLLSNYANKITVEEAYPMPNIARKFLDTFLMFQVPINGSSYVRLEKIPFEDVKKTSIYKFTNDESHITGDGFDPSLVPEMQKNVKYLLEMVKKVTPEHFKYLKS